MSKHTAVVRRVRESPMGWLYTAPALLIFSVFIIGPTAYTLYVSLFHWNALNTAKSKYIGLANYRSLLGSTAPSFLSSAWHSLYFSGAMVIGGTALSLAFALLLQRGGRLLGAARVAVFAPHATPVVATSLAWVWIFNPQFGLADTLLKAVHLPQPGWLQSTTWAMPSVIAYSLWHEVGFTVVLFLGGLAVISPELSEAARVDGANAWQEFWHVTWPQLRPVTLFVVIITSISSLQAFTQFYEMSQGGPVYATTTLSFLLYQEAFVFFDTGYGAALAIVLFAVTAAFTLLQRRTGDRISRSS
ncbi:multiple sugar transport system permease protein [Kitasatospora sp. MAA4]|uniref:carbohydrate ABC transporter permease n=1 Tax=Kitasatospora sp. MAA4 TaxID=3035093 RepID=UPI002473B420|nr:sugar ABC transporter permease [Kitasatospora sp. MAA4]MDH6137152.1 multiple sugar transport system permease protein [Kitasatospora sp. MAA4]